MATKNAVELILKATDLSSKTFADVSAAVTSLNAKLAEQTAAAAKGQVSVKELAATMRQLNEAGDALAKQQGVIELYQRLGGQLETAQEKAAKARAALDDLKASIAAQDEPTRAQTSSLNKLETAFTRAEAAAGKVQARLDAQAATLAKVGIDTTALAAAEQGLAATAETTRAGRVQAQDAIDSYDAKLRAHRAEVAETKRVEAEAAQAVAAAEKERVAAAEAAAAQVARLAKEEVDFLATYAEAERENNSRSLTAQNNERAAALKAREVAAAAEAKAEFDFQERYAEAERENNSRRLTEKLAAERTALAEFNAAVKAAAAERQRFDDDYAAAERENNSRRLTAELQATKEAEAGWQRLEQQRLRANAANVPGAGAGAGRGKQPAAGGASFLGLQGFELQNLSFQVNDIVTGLASGQRGLQVLAQQGGQVFQIFQGNLKNMAVTATTALRAIGIPISAAVAGIALMTAGVIAFVAASVRLADTQASIRQFSAELGVSADGTRYNATQVVVLQRELQRLGAGFDEAGVALRTFIRSGLQGDELVRAGKLALDLSHTYGVSLADAAKTVTEAFNGGYEAVKKLDAEYNVYTAKQLETIRNLFDEGKATEARAAAQDIFTGKLSATSKLVDGDFTRAWKTARTAVFDLLDLLASSTLARLAGATINGIANGLSLAATGLRAVLDSLPGGKGVLGDPVILQKIIDDRTASLAELEKRQAAGTLTSAVGAPVSDEAFQKRRAVLISDIAGAQERLNKINAESNLVVNAGKPGRDGQIAATERQLKLDSDAIDKQQKQLDINKRTPEQRIRAIGDQARETALSDHVSPPAANLIADKAMAAERLKIEDENRSLAKSLDDAANSAAAAADRSQKADLNRRLRAIDEQYEGFAAKVADLRRRGVERIEGKTLTDYELGLQKNREDLKTAERVKFAKEQASQQTAVQNELASLAAAADKAQTDSLAKQLAAVDEQYSHIYRTIAAAKAAGVTTAGGQPISELEKTIAAQEVFIKQQTTIKFYETQIGEATKARDETLRSIVDRVKDGTLSAAEGFNEATAANDKLNPKVAKLAQDALTFARALEAAHPSPQLEAFIASASKSLASTGTGRTSATGTEDTAIAAAGLEHVNTLITTRNNLERAFQELANAGIITQHEANTQSAAAYKSAAGEITAATDAFEAFIEAASSTLPAEQVALLRAELAKLRGEVAFVDPEFKKLKNTIENSIATSAVKALDTMATSIGNVVAGTESVGQAFRDAGLAVLQFLADVLKAVAEEIAKEQIIIALKAVSKSLGFHGGGVVGNPNAMSKPVDPAWFIGAPRYHDGAVVGLSADEQAAILKKGEEVLTREDPRNVLNGGRRAAGGGGGPTSIRNVLVLDNDLIPQAMQSSSGEAVTMAHIKKNVATIRQLVR